MFPTGHDRYVEKNQYDDNQVLSTPLLVTQNQWLAPVGNIKTSNNNLCTLDKKIRLDSSFKVGSLKNRPPAN